ncbi:MAG: fluoride efflux transporter CrcB [Ferruginibacter sp.]
MIRNVLLVGLGGSIGSMVRYAVSLLMNSKSFPYATLSVNIIGSFIIGVVFALGIKEGGLSGNWRLFLATGICGGFTTFSAFSLENMGLLQSGRIGVALTYIMISLVLGIAATFLGYQLIIKN